MQFSIVRIISYGKKNNSPTMAAIVNFGTDEAPELVTRHLKLKGGCWVGRNSDETVLDLKEIMGAYTYNKAVAEGAEERVVALEGKVNTLKGKSGVVEELKRLNERFEIAKAAADVAKSNLERSSKAWDKIDEDNPEFVTFV